MPNAVKAYNVFEDFIIKDEIVSIGGSPVSSVDVGFDLPVGAIPIMAWVHITTAITGAGGATGLAVGTSDNVAKYGELTALVKNTKIIVPIGGFIVLNALEDVKIVPTNGSETITGTLQDGAVRFKIIYVFGDDFADV